MSAAAQEITLDGKPWRSADDFYDALFAALGSPAWHGRNFDALRDSLAVGSVNRVETPYRLRIVGMASMASGVKVFVAGFADLIRELQAEGVQVSITCEP